jgi:putative transposase
MSAPDRRGLLQRDHQSLSIRRQCELLSVARSSVYRPPRPANDNDVELMRRIDQLYTAWPFLGSRRMTAMLNGEECHINRKRVQRLMRKMGIAALGPKLRTTKPAPGHTISPYLLRHMVIDRPNQVWAADITYVPIGQGFLYLVAIIDWASRAVLAWRLSNTMDTSFYVSALEEALARFGRPEVAGVGWTTCSSSGCGARSNTRTSISRVIGWPRGQSRSRPMDQRMNSRAFESEWRRPRNFRLLLWVS